MAKEDAWIKETFEWVEKHPGNLIMYLGQNPAEKRFWKLYHHFLDVIWECWMKGSMELPPAFNKYKDMPEFKELLKIWGITLANKPI